MKIYRTLAVVGALVMGAAMVSAQEKSAAPASGSGSSDKTVTYVGCLQPGPSGDTFLLSAAQQKGSKEKTKDALLKVVSGSDKVNLEASLTKQVEVKGTIEPAAKDSDLSKFTVTSVKWRADYCG